MNDSGSGDPVVCRPPAGLADLVGRSQVSATDWVVGPVDEGATNMETSMPLMIVPERKGGGVVEARE